MNPYVKLLIKSFSVFVIGLGGTFALNKATGQISLYDWMAVIWPGIYGLATYLNGVADQTPAPWSQAQAIETAKQTVQDTRDAKAVQDVLTKPPLP
jgi:hypothetical protein